MLPSIPDTSIFQLFEVWIKESGSHFVVKIFKRWHDLLFSKDLSHPIFHPFAWYSIGHEAENKKHFILVGRIDCFVLPEMDVVGKAEMFKFSDICE